MPSLRTLTKFPESQRIQDPACLACGTGDIPAVAMFPESDDEGQRRAE